MAGINYLANPEIAKQYENDPRTLLARQAIAQGTQGNPTAQGKYAWADGIARALGSVAGAYVNKQQMQKYGDAQAASNAALQTAVDPQAQAVAAAINGAPAGDVALGQAVAQGVAPPAASQPAQAAPMPPQPQAPPPGIPASQQPPTAPMQTADPTQAIAGAMGGANPAGAPPFPPATPAAMSGSPPKAVAPSIPDGPVGGYIERTALSAVPNAGVTSRQRSPAKNASVGGAANSFHLTDDARDFVPGKGMGMRVLYRNLRNAFDSNWDVINENDHVHVEPSKSFKRTAANAATPQVPGQPAQASDFSAETVPDIAKVDVVAPVEREVPGAVSSANMELAQRMIASGDPNLIEQGKAYLAKGATETTLARDAAANRQFDQNTNIYNADANRRSINERTNADALNTDRANIQARNFGRETREDEQAWNSTERGLDRSLTASEGAAGRDMQWRIANLNDATEKARIAAASTEEYLSNPTAIKDRAATVEALNAATSLGETASRALELNRRIASGGFENAGMLRDAKARYNADIAEIEGIRNQLVLDKMGGKLGAGVSNADVDFMLKATPVGAGYSDETNQRVLNGIGLIANRASDYNGEYLKARSTSSEATRDFDQNWPQYIKEVPLYDRQGNLRKGYIPYSRWRQFKNKGKK